MAGRKQDFDYLTRSVIAVYIILGLFCGLDAESDWGYEPGTHAPENWHLHYSDCGGRLQSPLNINTSDVLYDRHLQPFDFCDYTHTENVHLKLENIGGHTAEVILSGRELYVKGGSLPDHYKLENVHFHWGRNGSRGSEHKINGKSFPLEAHFVHRQRRFPNTTVAAPHPHGLAVIALLFKEGRRNVKYDPLLQHFDQIKHADNEVDIPTFAIKDLLPSRQLHYYRYYGSLTTPPCYESVTWSVAVDQVEISRDQIERFRSLLDEHNHQLVDDFRPVQPLNQRTITSTKNPNPGLRRQKKIETSILDLDLWT